MKGHDGKLWYKPQTGIVFMSGKRIHGTNIGDILNFITKPNPPDEHPKGTGLFLQTLGTIKSFDNTNVPNLKLRRMLGSMAKIEKRVGKGTTGQNGRGVRKIMRWIRF
jgi:hypothetical protein